MNRKRTAPVTKSLRIRRAAFRCLALLSLVLILVEAPGVSLKSEQEVNGARPLQLYPKNIPVSRPHASPFHTFFVNLDTRPDRLLLVREQLVEAGIVNATRVVPKRVTVQDMQEWNPSKSPVPFSCRKHAKLSLLITVLNLIARVLEDSKISDTILVVEDDVLISPGLLRALPLMLQSVPPDWDTLRLTASQVQ